MKFIVHNLDGTILRTGFCSDDAALVLQAHEGETAIEDMWEGTSDAIHKIVDGERVEFTPEPPPPLSITVLRAVAYPPIGDQLDVLWHAMDDKVLPMVPAFYDPIKAVKDAYPMIAMVTK